MCFHDEGFVGKDVAPDIGQFAGTDCQYYNLCITPFEGLYGCALHHQVDRLVVECHTEGLWDGISVRAQSRHSRHVVRAGESESNA